MFPCLRCPLAASFKAGETSTFVLKGVDVGYVRAVRVRMEPSASDPEWCLATIAVVSGDSTYEFTYGAWLKGNGGVKRGGVGVEQGRKTGDSTYEFTYGAGLSGVGRGVGSKGESGLATIAVVSGDNTCEFTCGARGRRNKGKTGCNQGEKGGGGTMKKKG